MKIIFWGTRGAISAPKSDQIIFGTHTTCIEIRNGDDSLLFDAGFGIGRYSDSLSHKSGNFHLFFTHFHWDHVQGIGYFIPIFLPNTNLYLYSPWTAEKLRWQLDQYFDYSFGPFRSMGDQNLKSQRHFYCLDQQAITVNGFEIAHHLNKHEGKCYGYSVARQGKKIAVITDHEAEMDDACKTWGTDYDVVIHDAQYTEQEYHQRRGLGHSSFPQAIANARNLGARKIIFTHHDPLRTDQELLAIEAALPQAYPALDLIIAREQEIYTV
jgi:phosphoribosyl 1,2-cyclic phosphodiesterase